MSVSSITGVGGGAESTNVTTHTGTLPTGLQDGDTVIVAVSLASSTTVTLNGGPFSTVTADKVDTSRSGVGAHVWVKNVLASHSGATVTFTTGSSLKVAAVFWVVRGADATTAVSFVSSTGTTSTSQPGPTSPTPAAGQIIVSSLHLATASAAPPASYTVPSGMTLRASQGTGGSSGRAAVAIAGDLTENATDGTSWSTDLSGTYVVVVVALKVASTSVAGSMGSTLALSSTMVGQLSTPGAVAGSLTLSASVAGKANVSGASASTLTSSVAMSGKPTTPGVIAGSVALSASLGGVPAVPGGVAATVALGASLAGKPSVPGAVAAGLTLTVQMAGAVTVSGSAAAVLVLTVEMVGFVPGPPLPLVLTVIVSASPSLTLHCESPALTLSVSGPVLTLEAS